MSNYFWTVAAFSAMMMPRQQPQLKIRQMLVGRQ